MNDLDNAVRLAGKICERHSLRYTPSGVPIVEARLLHCSHQLEAGVSREVQFECGMIAIGEQAAWLAAVPLDTTVVISGFFAAKSSRTKALVLHVQTINFMKEV